jgi:hypothetical protein
MVRDVRVGITGGCNFLVALGLLVYTEVIGAEILRLRGRRKPKREESFYCFYTEYMAQPRPAGDKVYEQFRHGAAHTYGFLAAHASVVGLVPDPDVVVPDQSKTIIQFPDGRSEEVDTRGAVEVNRGRVKVFLVNAYFRDFQRGLVKAATEYPATFKAPHVEGRS